MSGSLQQLINNEKYTTNNLASGVKEGDSKFERSIGPAVDKLVDNLTKLGGIPYTAPRAMVKGIIFTGNESDVSKFATVKSGLDKAYTESMDYIKTQNRLKQTIDPDKITDPVLKFNMSGGKGTPPTNWRLKFNQVQNIINMQNKILKNTIDPNEKASKKKEFEVKQKDMIEKLNNEYTGGN
jgi:hypothetical protein